MNKGVEFDALDIAFLHFLRNIELKLEYENINDLKATISRFTFMATLIYNFDVIRRNICYFKRNTRLVTQSQN